MLNKDEIRIIEKKIGYTFRDKALLCQAFTRASYRNEHPDARDNEVLEFFGDMVLSYVVCNILLDRYTFRDDNGLVSYMQEDAFTKMRSNCTNNEYLAEKIRALGIQDYLIMGNGDEKANMDEGVPACSNLFESLAAAVYLDSDKDTAVVREFVTRLLGL
jgi:ribonuclease-3